MLLRTNIVYFLVGLIGYMYIGILSLPIVILGICSTWYHYNENNKIAKNFDMIFAWVVIIVNVYLIFEARNIISTIGGIFAFISLYRYIKKIIEN